MAYIKGDQILNSSDRFVYLEEVYLMYPNRCELIHTETHFSISPLEDKSERVYSEDHGCYVQRYWELVAAPQQWLINVGFKRKL